MTSKALIVTPIILLFLSFGLKAQIKPAAPTSLEAEMESETEIDLEWEDNSKNEDFFVVERSVGNDDNFEVIAIIAKKSESYTDKSVEPKMTYYYRVKARNSTFFGNFDSDYSNIASATTAGPPKAPSGLKATTQSKTSIKINWKQGSDDTDKYRVERSRKNDKNFNFVTNVSSGTQSYIDGGLDSNTKYFYRVRASNDYGNSKFSNKDSDVTFQFPPTLNAIVDPDPVLEGAGKQIINLSGISAGGAESQTLTVKASSGNKSLIPNPTVKYKSPSATGTLEYTPVNGAFGTATITVTVTDDGPNDPPDNINNTFRTFTVTVERALPDFVVQNEVVPDLICMGEPFQVQCEVKNRGFLAAPASTLSIYFSAGDKTIDGSDVLLNTVAIPALEKNQKVPVAVDVSVDQVQAQGPYYVILKMDHQNEVKEINENNNAKTREFTLCLPDLAIENHTSDQTLLSRRQNFNVSFDLVNSGEVETQSHKIKYYLAKDQQTFNEDQSIGETNVSSVGAGETRSFEVGLTIPSDTEEGSYFLVFRADSENEVIEKDEDNNIRTLNITIQNLPDINIVNSGINPDVVAFGQTVVINTTIVNSGVEDTESSIMKFYLSSDSLISAGDLVFEPQVEIPELAIAQEVSYENLLDIPEELEEGTYYIIAHADDENIVWENNELNNLAVHEISILSDIPPVITGTDFPEYRIAGLDNTIIKIEAEDDVAISEVYFFYKGIRSTIWDSTNVKEENGFYQVSIPGAIFDELGLEYYFEVVDDVGLKAISDTGFTYMEYQGEGLPFSGLNFGEQQSDYQMVSIPLELSQKGVNSIFEDDLGPYDKTRWRLFTFRNGEVIEYGEPGEGLNQFEIGHGYWLIIKDIQDLDTGEGRTIKANQKQLYEITLTEGWNQIGNPYNFDFKWSDVLSLNGFPSGVSGDIKVFEQGYKSSDVLKSFQGGFVQANTTIKLKIPITKEEIVTGRIAGSKQKYPEGWYAGLSIGNSRYKHEIYGFGMNELAADGIDAFDETHLPDFGFLSNLSVKFNNKQFGKQSIAKDIVPLKGEHVWNLEIDNESADKYVYLSWNVTQVTGTGKHLVLYNAKNGLQVDMHNQPGIWIDAKDSDQLKIIYGDSEFLKKSQLPSSVVLGAGFPNPFHHSTKIPIALPESAKPHAVHLQVYNNLGQNVKTLMQGNYEAGIYQVEWDGSNEAGDKVKPGIYFYQLKVANNLLNQSASGRLVLE